MALLIVALVALAVLTSSDQLLALGFVGAVAGLIALLWGIGLVIRIGVARLPRPHRPLLRLALANLHRPGAQTDRLVVALGLGFSLFVALAVIDTSLSAELAGTAPAKAPRFFAIDLQPEDAARFRDAVTAASPGARVETVPSLRGSITVLRGVRVADMKAVPEDAWVLRGDRTITWAATVPPRNEVVAGRWWPADYRGPPLVSLEDKAAAALGLKIGDTITVSVLGVDVPARIASLRKIDWNGLGLNFAIIFSPGYIEEAPHGLLASVYSAANKDGAVAASGRTRRYDAVILKLLGGSRRQVLGAQALEYALLSLVLIIVALVMGSAAGWFVVVRLFDLAWAPRYYVVALTLAASVIVTLGTGLAGSVPALRARPAEALREL